MKILLSTLGLFSLFFLNGQIQLTDTIQFAKIKMKNDQIVNAEKVYQNRDQIYYINTISKEKEHLFVASIKELTSINPSNVNEIIFQVPEPKKITPKEIVQQENLSAQQQKPSVTFINNRRYQIEDKIYTGAEIEKIFKSTNPEAAKWLKKGRANNNAGNILMGGGIGLILGTAIGNLYLAESGKVSQGFGPEGHILGLAGIITSISLYITGRSQLKKAVSTYNESLGKNSSSVSVAPIVSQNGAGIAFQF